MTVSLLTGSTPVILIVDDDEVMRMLMRQFLEGEGYVVVEAEDGHDALEKLAAQCFDLVILDIAMPGIDGPGVCEHIRSSMADPPPIATITSGVNAFMRTRPVLTVASVGSGSTSKNTLVSICKSLR